LGVEISKKIEEKNAPLNLIEKKEYMDTTHEEESFHNPIENRGYEDEYQSFSEDIKEQILKNMKLSGY
jgi:hypothetical protein